MDVKGNIVIQGNAKVEVLPINANSLSTVVEVNGELQKRQLGDISLLPKESYIPGLSVSFPSIFNLNTESLDYNNRSLVVSLKNQLAGTAFMAPVTMNGTPAFRRIVKSDLSDAGVVFTDSNYVRDVVINRSPNFGQRFTVQRNTNLNTTFLGNTVVDTRSTQSGLGSDGTAAYIPNEVSIPNNTTFSLFHYLKDTTDWYSSIITKAWTNGYSAWKISGYASTNTDTDRDFYLSRTLADGSWGRDNKIWHDGNLTKLSQLQNDINFNGKYLGTTLNSIGYTELYSGDINTLPDGNYVQAISGSATNLPIGIGTVRSLISFGARTVSDKLLNSKIVIGSEGMVFQSGVNNIWRNVWHNGNLTRLSQLQNDINFDDRYIKLGYKDTHVNKGIGSRDLNNLTDAVVWAESVTLNRPNNTNSTILSVRGAENYGFQLAGRNSTFWLRGLENGVHKDWEIIAMQPWVLSQGYSKQNLTAGTNIQINGSVISATDTTYSVITLAELDGGIATTGRLVSSKNLNDWVNTKIKPSVLEYTPQKGITNPLWSSNAVGEYSIAIGNYSNATAYNSLALMQGARAEGYSSVAIGEYSQALGSRSVAIGSYVTSINESYSFGFAVTNTQSGCVAIGEFNTDIPFGNGIQRTNNSETPLFVVGNGLSSMIRSNAKVLYRDGSTRNYGRQYYDETMRSTIDFTKDNTLVDVKYVKENGGGGLPNDPFSSISSSGFSGDTIDNPKFTGAEPNNLDVVVLAIERSQGLNVWDKATAAGNKFSLFGIYLKTYKKVLLRGYYKNGSSSYINNSYLFNANSKTLEWGWTGTAGVDYVLLGNIIDAQTGLILFNPR